ncbi:hypothetical protein SAMN05444158_4590 [Bradyrhizobium canariense]|uniref:Secreted protein n=1 Tax=Bradyrhizobium canariense TaxID=255045 RepID=A0A1H1Y1G8_9BRAD|nr:hypothetical protein [Bradyrhizobium canariense]SDT15292.1 hypothetical protein SAMN05444158_4590 [Bradyrhizobium canariense]
MTYRMYGAFIASLSVVALVLTANETFAAGSGAVHRGGFTSAHAMARGSVAQSFRHGRRNNRGTFWPGDGGFYYEPSDGEPPIDATPPTSGDNHYTYTYDVPWDWAHRFPPAVTPSEHPYVPSCPAETVTVPGHDGKEQTVNITRCY